MQPDSPSWDTAFRNIAGPAPLIWHVASLILSIGALVLTCPAPAAEQGSAEQASQETAPGEKPAEDGTEVWDAILPETDSKPQGSELPAQGNEPPTQAGVPPAQGEATAPETSAPVISVEPVRKVEQRRPPSLVEEIVISAKRQGVTEQKLSSSFTALGAEDIQQLQIQDTRDLAVRVPSLVTGESFGTPQIFIRGIGQEATTSGQDPGVAVHVDGIYLGRVFAAYTAQVDLERVEVLRGPQGTLFGRNATGGAVNYFSRRPTQEFESKVTTLGGALGRAKFTGVVNGGLTDELAGRVVLAYENKGGYVDDLNQNNGRSLGDQEVSAGRGSLLWEPADAWQVLLIVDGQKDQSATPATVLLDVPKDMAYSNQVEGRDYIVVKDQRKAVMSDHSVRPIFTFEDFSGETLRIEWQPGPFDLVSLTGFRVSNYDNSNDGDATRLDYQGAFVSRNGKQLSQEFNLSGRWGPVDTVFGLYAFRENAIEKNDAHLAQGINPAPGYTATPPLPPFHVFYNMDQNTTSYAAFTDLTYSLFERLRLVGGLRYTQDQKETAQQIYITFDNSSQLVDTCSGTPTPAAMPSTGHATKTWSNLSGKAGLEFDISETYTTYAVASRGFKAGGFGDFSTCGTTFNPEFATNYEVGLKGAPFGRDLTFSVSSFYMNYADLQVQVVIGASVQTVNAASAVIKGTEGQFNAKLNEIVDGLSLDGNLSLLNSKYNDFVFGPALSPTGEKVQLAGYPITHSPKASGLLGIGLSRPIGASDATLTGRVEGYATGRSSLNPIGDRTSNGRPYFVQKPYFLGNAYLTYARPDWHRLSVQAFMKNITNQFYFNSVIPYGTLYATNGFPALGRTGGVELTFSF